MVALTSKTGIQKALYVVCKSGETSTVFHLDNNGGVEVNLYLEMLSSP